MTMSSVMPEEIYPEDALLSQRNNLIYLLDSLQQRFCNLGISSAGISNLEVLDSELDSSQRILIKARNFWRAYLDAALRTGQISKLIFNLQVYLDEVNRYLNSPVLRRAIDSNALQSLDRNLLSGVCADIGSMIELLVIED